MTSPHNLHNLEVYSQNSSAAADFLAVNKSVQIAIKHWIESLSPSTSDEIKVLELGSSSRPTRWQTISSLTTNKKWHVTLSDFSLNALPPTELLPNTSNFYFSYKKLDLLSDPLPSKSSYDFIIATYVFDAIWFPQDKYINSINYPGGLIAKVQEAFSTCLSNGFFISIDRTSTKLVPEYELSGPARFKTENYQLAKSNLESLGFKVSLLPLDSFLLTASVPLPLDLSDHSVLIVSK